MCTRSSGGKCTAPGQQLWYRRVSGGSVWEALIFRPSDRRFYGELLQRLRTRALPTEKKAT